MRNHLPRSIDTLLVRFDTLQTLQQKALALTQLNHAVNALLPKQLQKHCRVANLKQNTLILEVENANWLTLLRYEHDNLRKTLRESILPSLTGISMYINPNMRVDYQNINQSAEKNEKIREISPQSAEILLQLSTKCSPSLQQKIRRIVQSGTQKDK